MDSNQPPQEPANNDNITDTNSAAQVQNNELQEIKEPPKQVDKSLDDKQEENSEEEEEEEDSEDEDDWRSSFWGRGGGGGFWSRRERPLADVKELWANENKLSLEERRKRYHCRRFVKAEDFPTWDVYSKGLDKTLLTAKTDVKVDSEINKKIALYNGDITSIEVEAIVNAANEGCLGGGGVDGAIHSAAGNMLYEECRTLNGCPTGDAKITRGYDLPAKYVIHTVGPISQNPKKLTSCYQRTLDVAVENNIKSVVFCGISTGIFGYPLYEATQIALSTTRKWLETNKDKVDKVIFCTFLAKEKICYDKLTPIYFPVNIDPKPEESQQPKETVSKEEL